MAKKPDRRRRPPTEPARRGPGAAERLIRGMVGLALRFGLRLGAAAALILAVAVFAMHQRLPEPEALIDGRERGSVTLLDRHGRVFAWRGEQFGGEVRPGDVSPHLIDAILAAEDRRFLDHWGVDPRGLARAALTNLRAGRIVQGGSTITQQVAKNVFLTSERSLERKLKEIPMALAMELKYDKEAILALYLNRVYLGAGTWGFEAAARRYFGKSAAAVNPAEAALLAGLLKAPSRLAPTNNLADAQARAAVVLRAMQADGRLSEAQAEAALARPAQLSAQAEARAGGQFADYVMEAAPDYLTRETAEDVVIATTFDLEIQRAAEAAVREVFAARVRSGSKAQAAVAVMSPDGAVRALVGGRKPEAGGFNRATQALRQPGSAFKPVVYAAAVARGFTPEHRIADAPLTVEGWSPKNYGGGHVGPVTLRRALADSVNTAAVRLQEKVGREAVATMARKLGFDAPAPPVPALALGVAETTLLDMTGVYGAFASGGFRAEPYAIRELRVRGAGSPLLTGGAGPRRRVLDARVAGLVTAMMAETLISGTGVRAALPDRPAAGKTGTSQEARDAWFIGFTPQYVAGVWMGYDDNTPLSQVTGGGLPAEIWRETMARIHDGLPAAPLPGAGSSPQRPEARVAEAEAPQRSLLQRVLDEVGDVFSR